MLLGVINVQKECEMNMRSELKKIEGQKQKFRGTLERFGTKSNWKTGKLERTVLLSDVTNYAGNIITDHLWFNYTKKLEALKLKEGDRIQFYGIVKPYIKGYEKNKLDYKITYPSKIVKLTQKSIIL